MIGEYYKNDRASALRKKKKNTSKSELIRRKLLEVDAGGNRMIKGGDRGFSFNGGKKANS